MWARTLGSSQSASKYNFRKKIEYSYGCIIEIHKILEKIPVYIRYDQFIVAQNK